MYPLRGHQLGALQDATGATSRRGRRPGRFAHLGRYIRLVHFIMNVFAGVHVEAGVEEGAVTQTLVRVMLQDLDKVEFGTWLLGFVHLRGIYFLFFIPTPGVGGALRKK